MHSVDLFALQQRYTEQGILLCFNGPLSSSLIEEIGKALRNHMESQAIAPSSAMDVFGVYIEITQNIRHYFQTRAWPEAVATVVIARDPAGHYLVSAGNRVRTEDGRALLRRLAELAPLDKAALRARYKEQMRAPRAEVASGAGLGLIDMARKASAPLRGQLQELADGSAFFSLGVSI
ncbi:MAG: hypothetical protein DYH17_08725 [Xanthomonadales bacterium PRO6]|nr:hypothetical protein [Xanthomonadales bacterium]MCE7931445.1 hypothetical protein [Xanthomonadales bacterium PRO6]